MIFENEIPAERKKTSQAAYRKFNIFNGFAYMCLGETVIILFAVSLGAPDYIVSVLSAMLFFGYLLLPLGRVMTARTGAAISQAVFWRWRNVAALFVASASLVNYFGWNKTAIGMVILGAFLFYGFRAAGFVTFQPMIGEITGDDDRASLIARATGNFYLFCLIALIVIVTALKFRSDIWMLAIVIAVGSSVGIFSSRYLRKMDETKKIKESSGQSFWHEIAWGFSDNNYRRILYAIFVVNLGNILVLSNSMLALKRGYGVSDADALFFAMIQFGACALFSYVTVPLATAYGPRKMILFSFVVFLIVCAIWQVLPNAFSFMWTAVVFTLLGCASVAQSNGFTHYILQMLPVEKRMTASTMSNLIAGVGSGLTAIFLAGGILYFLGNEQGLVNLTGYRIYFAIIGVFLLSGFWFILRLIPLPKEKRFLPKSWTIFH